MSDLYVPGWINDPVEVERVVSQWASQQGCPARYADYLDSSADDERTVCLWDAEVKLYGRPKPTWDQRRVGTCFPPGTLVRLADGRHKPIEHVMLLEEVLTAEGNTGRVTHCFAKRHKGEVCNLVLWGHSHLKATPEHPILTKRGYVPVGEITSEDWVAMPRYLPSRSAIVVTADHVDANARKYAKSGGERKFSGVVGRKSVSVTLKPLPDVIELTPSVGSIFGLFLAEGSTDRSRVVWTFGANEADTLAADLRAAIKDSWGADTHVQVRAAHNTIKVILYGAHWSRLFESLCSSGAGGKRLHPDLAAGPETFLRAVLKGWLSGDGYASRRAGEKDHGVTVSHALALDMFSLGIALGERACINRSEPRASHGVKRRQVRWDVKYISQGDNFRVEMDDGYVWRKVRWVNREDYDGWVYNLEVEGDNSYVAEGISVHNCVSFGWGRAANDIYLNLVASGKSSPPPGDVATEPIYAGSRVEVGGGRVRGDGSIGAWAAKWVRDWGILFRSIYAGGYDLRQYSESMSRDWGVRGVPDDLEPVARLQPVKAVAQVRTATEAWQTLGSRRPVPVCSDYGFTNRLVDGFLAHDGVWNHCMFGRARLVSRKRGRCFVIQNSWDKGWLSGDPFVEDKDGRQIELPEGCFCVDWNTMDSMLRQGDSHTLSDVIGFPVKRELDWVW